MKRALQGMAFSFVIACLLTGGAGAQQLPPGTHVMVKPTGNDAIGGTIVRFDRGAYIIHFDQPWNGSSDLRVSTANVQAGGAAGGGNPNNNAHAGQKRAAPQAQPQLNPANQNATQAPAGSLAAQFQEIIRQKYVGAAQPDDQVTVTFQRWSMTGPAPYQDTYAGVVNQHTILGGSGPTVNAYQIQTKFTVDHHYTSSGAHNMNYIAGPYVGFKDKSGQLQTRAAGGGSNTSKYIPGP